MDTLKIQKGITEGDFENFLESQKHHLDVTVVKCFANSLLTLQSQDKLVSSPPPISGESTERIMDHLHHF